MATQADKFKGGESEKQVVNGPVVHVDPLASWASFHPDMSVLTHTHHAPGCLCVPRACDAGPRGSSAETVLVFPLETFRDLVPWLAGLWGWRSRGSHTPRAPPWPIEEAGMQSLEGFSLGNF